MPFLLKKSWLRWPLIAIVFLLLLALPRKILTWRYADKIFQLEEAPSRSVAIVFGAGLRRDGRPSAVLADRVKIAAKLYLEDKVPLILVSGSVRPPTYNEPEAMRELAIELGVAAEDILLDPRGSRTYDTCLHAKEEFGLDNVILVTQGFHLPRALSICDALGINAVGITADLREYSAGAYRFWNLREYPATLIAIWDTYIARPIPFHFIQIDRNPLP
ncbi:MAG: YdcF family protein [Chloroflexi bacterium]|nr:YdcF family protein [Chloroflexota bacterium]